MALGGFSKRKSAASSCTGRNCLATPCGVGMSCTSRLLGSGVSVPENLGWEIGRSPISRAPCGPWAPRSTGGPRAPLSGSDESRVGLNCDQSLTPFPSPPCLPFPACGPRAPPPDCFPCAVARPAKPRASALAFQGSFVLQGSWFKKLLKFSAPGARSDALPSAAAPLPSWT